MSEDGHGTGHPSRFTDRGSGAKAYPTLEIGHWPVFLRDNRIEQIKQVALLGKRLLA